MNEMAPDVRSTWDMVSDRLGLESANAAAHHYLRAAKTCSLQLEQAWTFDCRLNCWVVAHTNSFLSSAFPFLPADVFCLG